MSFIYDLADSWNSAGTTFTAIKMNVTDTASAAGSKVMDLQIGGSSLFVLDKAGNVGIGVASPSFKLQVNGTQRISKAGAGFEPAMLSFSTIAETGAIYRIGMGTAGSFTIGRSDTSTTDITLTQQGNLGIGTTSPAQVIHVSRAVAVKSAIRFDNSVVTGNMFGTDADGSLYAYQNGGYPFIVYTNAAERMRIDASGNVGIGTSSPGSRLDVQAANFVNAAVRVSSGPSTVGAYAGVDFAEAGFGTALGRVRSYGSAYGSSLDSAMEVWNTRNSFLRFGTNDTERMRLDASGNLGIGVTPSAWASSVRALELPTGSFYSYASGSTSVFYMMSNAYFNGTNNIYKTSAAATQYAHFGGAHQWFNAPAGTAGNAITFTQAMTLDASGNLGIGTTTPSPYKLNVNRGSQGAVAQFTDGIESTFVISTASGILNVGQANNFPMAFLTNNTERMRINATGNVAIGNTAPRGLLHVGVTAGSTEVPVPTGNFAIVRGGGYATAGVGGIQLSGGFGDAGRVGAWQVKAVGSGTAGAFINDLLFTTQNSYSGSETERMRIDSNGNLLVGATSNPVATPHRIYASASNYTLGLNSESATGEVARFYSNGTAVGTIAVTSTTTTYNTSSDARLKHDIIDAPEASDVIDAIKVRSFKWNADDSEQRYGMVAQELLEVAPEAVSVPADENEMMGVDYSKLVPMLIKEVQSLRARVAQLEGN